jgi:glycosyltransferase involved in cell wall biosynthesis
VIRVAVDGRRLQDQPLPGTGRRLIHLLPHIATMVDLVVLTDKRRPAPPLGDYCEVVPLAVPRHLPEPFWLQGSAAAWLRGFKGVFNGTYNAVPLAYRGRSVVTFLDLTWEHHPEGMTLPRRASFLLQARLSARRAEAVVTISEHARQSIVETYRVPPERVFVAPPAVDPWFSQGRAVDAGPILERLGITGPYVIALGGTARRGLEVAVEAWRRLPAEAGRPQLVVVGAEVPPPYPGIVHAGRVDDHDWSALLAGATVFCYPTRFEGYGMPALEAAASGVPVVCAAVASLPEVLSDAAEWCATPTVADIAPALERLMLDPERREALRQAGIARAAAATTWADSARVEVAAYELASR